MPEAAPPPANRSPIALHWRILIGLGLGVLVGLILSATWTNQTWASLGVDNPALFLSLDRAPTTTTPDPRAPTNAGATWLAHTCRLVAIAVDLTGDLFLAALRALSVPIVLCSLVVGVASLGDPRRLGRIGLKTVLIYLATTAFAVVLGIALANLFKPGLMVPQAVREQFIADNAQAVAQRVTDVAKVPSLWQQLLAAIPTNPFRAVADGNMLQVITLSLALGLGLAMVGGTLRAKADHAVGVFEALGAGLTVLIELLMKAAPYAVFCLIAPQVAQMGLSLLAALAAFALVVLAGLAVILFVEYPILLRLFASIGPRRFFSAMAPAQLLAFSTSSSNATLPATIHCTTHRLGVDRNIASFVCPLGATINMDGTALHQAICCLFIAQLAGIELTAAQQLTLVALATLSSIGAPGIPSGGIVMLVAVLQGVGLPPSALAGLALVIAIDRPLDMCRTVVNVSGDALTAAIVAKSEGALGEPRLGI
jgi:Na+/H+-dicarboxylate symporter